MNLNVTADYQSTNFKAKKQGIKHIPTILGTVVTGISATEIAKNATKQDMSMTADELNGRTQVLNNSSTVFNPGIFNQEVSFNYFAKGKLKNIPEYIEKGKKRIAELDTSDKKDKLNTLEYQEKIVDKILSEDALINNESIRNNLYGIINYDYDFFIPHTEAETKKRTKYFESEANAQIKFLDAYAKDTKMQKNKYINENLSDFVRDIANYTWYSHEDIADMMIEILKNNTENNDEKFFSSLNGLTKNNLAPELIKKVQSDKRLYDKLGYFVLYNINGGDKDTADKIIKVLDNYLENYSGSKLVEKKIGSIVWESFSYDQKEDPVEFAANMMKKLVEKEKATESETALQFCERTASKLANIKKGKYDDENKSDVDVDNVNKRIDMIRKIRTEIKDNVSKYTDEASKAMLRWNLITVIDELKFMKQVRDKLGWAIIGYADVTDEQKNKEILQMLE